MKRKRAALCWVALFVLCAFSVCNAQQDEEMLAEMEAQLEEYDFSQWQRSIEEGGVDLEALGLERDIGAFIEELASGLRSDLGERGLQSVLRAAAAAFKENLGYVTTLLALGLLTGLVSIFLDQTLPGMDKLASFMLCGACITGLSVYFCTLFAIAKKTVSSLSGFLETATPVLTTLLAASGGTVSAGLVRPLTVFLSGTVAGLFSNLILPMILTGGVIMLVKNFTQTEGLAGLYALIKSLVKWIIGIVFTVYIGTLSVQGMSVAGVDSIGLRTAKYALDKSVPIIGGAVSGTYETVRSCTLLIKNAAGIACAVGCAGFLFEPLMKLALSGVAMKACAALCGPVADARFVGLLSDASDICNYLFAAVLAAGIMFIITAGSISAIGAG